MSLASIAGGPTFPSISLSQALCKGEPGDGEGLVQGPQVGLGGGLLEADEDGRDEFPHQGAVFGLAQFQEGRLKLGAQWLLQVRAEDHPVGGDGALLVQDAGGIGAPRVEFPGPPPGYPRGTPLMAGDVSEKL